MSPAQFNDGQMPKRDINCARPSPLKINKDSHFIHKSSSSLSSSSSSSSLHHPTGTQQQRHRPVIIYTHSPKIIHTQPCDFMALVQKLTGLSQSDDEDMQPPLKPKGQASSPEASNNNMIAVGHDDNESSSVITDDNCGGGGGLRDIRASSSLVSTIFDPPNSYIPNIPLFNRAQTDFFYAPRPFYRYPDYPNIDSSISPLILEAAKGFSEYGN